jgi:hypothetical protein
MVAEHLLEQLNSGTKALSYLYAIFCLPVDILICNFFFLLLSCMLF